MQMLSYRRRRRHSNRGWCCRTGSNFPTQSAHRRSGRFEPKLSHGRQNVGLLNGLRQVCRKQAVVRVVRVRTVRAHCNDRRAGVLVVCRLDVSGCTLAINFATVNVSVRSAYDVNAALTNRHVKVHQDTVEFCRTRICQVTIFQGAVIGRTDITHSDTDSLRTIRNYHTTTTKTYKQCFDDLRRNGIVLR